MILVYSKNQIPIRLTEERWAHIQGRHPEMASQRTRVLETVEFPDLILQGDFGELLAVRYYPQTPLTSKHLVVVYRELSPQDGFIVTAYLANRPSARRDILWKP